uniref:Uncharacterized protein n=1 Tax=Arabidopsis thaliana TaxID=3702 RepID=Q570X8_ARATH|nr:hypothetical protein [Arabidopsis thaliana]
MTRPVSGSTILASIPDDNNPTAPYFRLSSTDSVEAPEPCDSVNAYP